MRPSVENILAVLLLILAEAWFLNGLFAGRPGWDAALATLAAFAALFAKDYIKARLNRTAGRFVTVNVTG